MILRIYHHVLKFRGRVEMFNEQSFEDIDTGHQEVGCYGPGIVIGQVFPPFSQVGEYLPQVGGAVAPGHAAVFMEEFPAHGVGPVHQGEGFRFGDFPLFHGVEQFAAERSAHVGPWPVVDGAFFVEVQAGEAEELLAVFGVAVFLDFLRKVASLPGLQAGMEKEGAVAAEATGHAYLLFVGGCCLWWDSRWERHDLTNLMILPEFR